MTCEHGRGAIHSKRLDNSSKGSAKRADIVDIVGPGYVGCHFGDRKRRPTFYGRQQPKIDN